MLTYALSKETYFLPKRERVSYGIVVLAHDPDTIVASVRDITPDKERLLTLIEDCNHLHLELCHLEDVVYNFLC